MRLLPKEHGAYGQVAFPLATARAVSGVSVPAAFITFAVVACFLAHEPLLVLLSVRGPRASREQSRLAGTWRSGLGATAAVGAALAGLRLLRTT